MWLEDGVLVQGWGLATVTEMRMGCTSAKWGGSFEPGRLEFCPLAAPAGCVRACLKGTVRRGSTRHSISVCMMM